MSLRFGILCLCLKRLQEIYVPHGSPWVPQSDGNVVRFINEIVMEEESDQAYNSNGERYAVILKFIWKQ